MNDTVLTSLVISLLSNRTDTDDIAPTIAEYLACVDAYAKNLLLSFFDETQIQEYGLKIEVEEQE
jgi:hypothetical protein